MFLPGSRIANDTLDQGFLRWAATVFQVVNIYLEETT